MNKLLSLPRHHVIVKRPSYLCHQRDAAPYSIRIITIKFVCHDLKITSDYPGNAIYATIQLGQPFQNDPEDPG